ncbi:hypothetical protein [Enterobacter hormaechei]|uniref:hypothetical protein n=1 Tax=Enterobacter hormaechei TaxID=158836 RepID=UPI00197D0D03|nr:hypothetical protein [Enterobacter hormaechei]MBN4835585.1 hypothetical protein [Enterobacter hormaechei]
MIRSGIAILFTLTAFAALAEDKIDPRDPAIWQDDKKSPPVHEVPCEVFSSSVCPAYEDEKSNIQRERERREDRRWRAGLEQN